MASKSVPSCLPWNATPNSWNRSSTTTVTENAACGLATLFKGQSRVGDGGGQVVARLAQLVEGIDITAARLQQLPADVHDLQQVGAGLGEQTLHVLYRCL